MKNIHDFTVWKVDSIDINGQPSYDGPFHFKGRFEKRQVVFLNTDGRETRGNSVIYTEDTNASIADEIYVGISNETSPVKGSFEIKDYRAIPNLRGTRTEYRIIV